MRSVEAVSVREGLTPAIILSGATIRTAHSGTLDAAYFDTIDVFVVGQLADITDGGGIIATEAEALQNFTRTGGVVILGLTGQDAEPDWLDAFGFSNRIDHANESSQFSDNVDSAAHALVTNVAQLYIMRPETFDAPQDAQVLATWANLSAEALTIAAVLEGFDGGTGEVVDSLPVRNGPPLLQLTLLSDWR